MQGSGEDRQLTAKNTLDRQDRQTNGAKGYISKGKKERSKIRRLCANMAARIETLENETRILEHAERETADTQKRQKETEPQERVTGIGDTGY
jgi:hypothetical protein